MKLVCILKRKPAQELMRDFPPNSRVCLHEPFFKILADGNHGLRVEDEKMFVNTVSGSVEAGGLDAVGLKEQATKCFKGQDFDKAVEFYERAIARQKEENSADPAVRPIDFQLVPRAGCQQAACRCRFEQVQARPRPRAFCVELHRAPRLLPDRD